ncbi:MAG: hypothetical protein HOO67_05080 [Candidatus Peribacteraceae bacterium]|nr:hypothetical protein [Candidatus Peribacteraceae bacterium]
MASKTPPPAKKKESFHIAGGILDIVSWGAREFFLPVPDSLAGAWKKKKGKK